MVKKKKVRAIPLRGRDVMLARDIRRQLMILNAAFDGPGEVAVCEVIMGMGQGYYAVSYAGAHGVVTLPGDNKPFPFTAYTQALLCAEVLNSDAVPGRPQSQ